MNVSIQLTGLADLQRKLGALGRQVPFAASRALNTTANEIQEAQRQEVRSKFTLRRPDFILRTIYRKPGEDFATKGKLMAGVRIDERRDVLRKFEAGGRKTPVQGSTVGVPQDVKRTKADVVTRANRPSGFNLRRVGDRIIGDKRTFLVKKGGRSFLLLQRASGKTAKRAGGALSRGRDPNVRVLYLFRPSVRIPASLNFVRTAMTVADRRMRTIFEQALADAIRTAK